MRKYKIAHYKESNSIWFVNGGKLFVTDTEYVVKCFFKTVAAFKIDKTFAHKISYNLSRKGINLSDNIKSIDLYFPTKTLDELYELFNLK